MSGEQLPQSTVRDLKRLEKRLYDVEMRLRGLAVRSLDQLDDTQILYGHPTRAPKPGEALVWDDTIDTEFGGAWESGWPTVDYITHSVGSVASGVPIDAFGSADPPPGLYVASVVIQATPPADCCGWIASAGVDASGALTVINNDWAQVGLGQGIWTGSTGDSGTYGWQAPTPPYPLINASALAEVGISEGGAFTASGMVLAYVLADPGSTPPDFGAKTCTTTSPNVSITVAARRISPALP